MAECVSCGSEVPQGKLFCDDCYLKMKGRWGPRGSADSPTEMRPATTGRLNGRAETPEPKGKEATPAGEAGAVRRASGDLTPAAAKNIVSLKPELNKAARDRDKTSQKKFAVTITLSERTYENIERMKNALKRKKGKETPVSGAAGKVEGLAPAKPRKVGRKTGPHGRPKLKAVESASRREKKGKGGRLAGLLEYRERGWDGGDYAAAATATAALILCIALPFLNWKKVVWVGQATVSQEVKGFELGVPVYILLAVACLAWLFLVVTKMLARSPLKVDWGVVFFVAGIVVFALVMVALAQNERILDIAWEKARESSIIIPDNALIGRETLLPGYLMIYLVAIPFTLAGMMRLYERREKGESA